MVPCVVILGNTCCQAKRKCSGADSAGAGTAAVECPIGYLPKYGVGKNCCDGATCGTAVANSSDTNPCCREKGKCGYADSAGAGTTAVVCPTEYLPKYGVDKNCCNSATCVTAVANSSDTNSCYQANWKCGDAVGAGAGAIVVVCPTEYLPKYSVDEH